MALTETQRQELRRILGYPNLANAASTQLGYPGYASPFAQWQPYAWLEDRFTTIAPGEEVEIFGQESSLFSQFLLPATLAFTIATPSAIVAGATLTFNVSSGLASVVVTAAAGDTPTTMASKSVAAFLAASSVVAILIPSSSGPTFTVTSQTPGNVGNGVAVNVVSSDPSLQVGLVAPAGVSQTPSPFITLPTTGYSIPGTYSFGVTQGGANPPGEYYSLPDQPVVVYGYVPLVRILEGDFANARKFMFFTQAGEFTPRADEMGARKAMLRHYRMKIAERLNVPLDPDLVGNSRNRSFRSI